MTDLPSPNLWRKLIWMAAIWAGSVVALAVVAVIFRFWLQT